MAYTTIPKSSANFSTNLYTGTGSNLTINTGHQSDLIWIKQRATIRPNCLFDSVNSSNFAGGNSKYLVSNTYDPLTSDNSTQITANSSTGFSIGTDNSDQINNNGDTAVAWSWKAGTTSGIATDGTTTITPSAYSFNQTSGFSIIKYSGNGVDGAYLPHGLGVSPKVMIVKRLVDTGWDWYVYHVALGNQKYLQLNETSAISSTNGMWGSYTPTSVNMKMSNDAQIGASGKNYIMYCFADVQGYSKMGSYLGNGHANGTFAYTGFKPAFILVKNTGNSARNWQIYDSKRIGYNYNNYRIATNLPQTEESNLNIDIYSNGFKARSTDADVNENAKTYIYMAFAEEPLVSTNGTPATAR